MQDRVSRLPQLTQTQRTLSTIPRPGPSYSNLARPASVLVPLEEHEIKVRSSFEIAANILHKRFCNAITHVDCGNGYCCSNIEECDLIQSATQCRLGSNLFSFASSARLASVTSTHEASQSRPPTAQHPMNKRAVRGEQAGFQQRYPKGLGTGAIVGIVLAILIIVSLIVGLLWFRRRRHRSNKRALGDYSPTETNDSDISAPDSTPPKQQPTDMYAGSNYGKGGVAGPPPAEFSNELDSKEKENEPELDAGMDAIPARELGATSPLRGPKADAVELPAIDGSRIAELPS